jgi:hypothetical protein
VLGLSLGETYTRPVVAVELKGKTWTFEPLLNVTSSWRLYEAFVDFDGRFLSSDEVMAALREARSAFEPHARADSATILQLVGEWDAAGVSIMAICSFSPIDQPGECHATGETTILDDVAVEDGDGQEWTFHSSLEVGDTFRRLFAYVTYDDRLRTTTEWTPILLKVKRELESTTRAGSVSEISIVAIWSGDGPQTRVVCDFNSIDDPGTCAENSKRRITRP